MTRAGPLGGGSGWIPRARRAGFFDDLKRSLEFGATDIVTDRGDEGVARIKEMTDRLGAHSVIEALGTQESMIQAIRSTRPGGHVGFVGVTHDVQIPGSSTSFPGSSCTAAPLPFGATCRS